MDTRTCHRPAVASQPAPARGSTLAIAALCDTTFSGNWRLTPATPEGASHGLVLTCAPATRFSNAAIAAALSATALSSRRSSFRFKVIGPWSRQRDVDRLSREPDPAPPSQQRLGVGGFHTGTVVNVHAEAPRSVTTASGVPRSTVQSPVQLIALTLAPSVTAPCRRTIRATMGGNFGVTRTTAPLATSYP
ncbi:hypothetical protein Esti_001145 [Eimeria stiedai]